MSMTTSTILLAEEHDATRVFLADNLMADGYRVLIAPDRPSALALMSTAHPDLILVDINGQTLALLDAIRAGDGFAGRMDPDTPLIVLSRDADRLQRIRVLERGGDDVVCKPFAYPELRARIAAVLRRSEIGRGARVLRAGPIVIDVRSREVRVCDRVVELSAKEYQLLVTLAGEPTRVFTREELLRSIWGLETFGHTRTLDSHASRLRRKLCGDSDEKLVVTVWGVGFRLIDVAAHPAEQRTTVR
jgi:DNA-binding response OmpR family regulator